jgi:hypothetical protein
MHALCRGTLRGALRQLQNASQRMSCLFNPAEDRGDILLCERGMAIHGYLYLQLDRELAVWHRSNREPDFLDHIASPSDTLE